MNGSEIKEVGEAIKQFISESEERLEIIRQEKEEKECVNKRAEKHMRRILKDSFENICYLSARKDEEPKILRPFCLQSNKVIALFYFQL